MSKPDFDVNAAHTYFSAYCFNKAWELIEKTDRTPEQDEEMMRLALASHWHWTKRPDYSRKNMSVAYWQISRVYAVLGQAENALRYGRLCLDASLGDVPPFYLAYAYEALARAEAVARNQEEMKRYLSEARRVAELVSDPEERHLLLKDMRTIQPRKKTT